MMRDSVGRIPKIDVAIDATQYRYPEESSAAVTLQIVPAK